MTDYVSSYAEKGFIEIRSLLEVYYYCINKCRLLNKKYVSKTLDNVRSMRYNPLRNHKFIKRKGGIFIKKFKRLSAMFLALIMLANTNLPAFANSTTYSLYTNENLESNGNVVVTDTGIYINGTYYTQEQFIQLLDTAKEVKPTQTRSATVALVAGTWWIPDVGQVVITTAGAVIVGGAVIATGTWIYNSVSGWFAQKAEIDAAKVDIPSRLKDVNENVKVGDFNQKVSGKTAYREKGGWTIEKDTAGHGGKKCKLKNKSVGRVAPLDENGKVLGR